MDLVEFKHLTGRVVATRNTESRAFLKAFDVAPGITSRWTERSRASWRVWSSANAALREAVAQLDACLGRDGPQAG